MEGNPALKFAYKYRQSIAFALYVALLMSTVTPVAMARPQISGREGVNTGTRAARTSASLATVAQSRTRTWRDKLQDTGRMIPSSAPVRSTKGVKGFSGGTRLQIGGSFGSNVQEQVVDITNFGAGSEISDERHPFWSGDEQTVFFSSNRGGARYQLYRVTANASPNPATSGTDATAITNEAGAVHDFPALNAGGNRIAYIKSLDDGKTFHLYQSTIPGVGQTIAPQPTSASLTFNRQFGGETITSVGRPSWLSGTEIVFSATLGTNTKDILVVDIQSRLLRRLTSGTAAEENVAVSPDGNFIAFDSDATAYTGGASNSVGTARNIFVVNTVGTEVTQITNVDDTDPNTPRVASDSVSSVQPAWSRSNVVPIFNTQAQYYLAFASNRQANPAFDPTSADPTQPAYISANTLDIFYVRAIIAGNSTQPAQPVAETNAAETRKLDTADLNLRWDDQYPTFPPLINLQRLSFQSNRKGSSATTFVAHNPADQNDLFIASLIDITAPTLLRYDLSRDTGEIVHINLGTTFNPSASVRSRSDGITPGSSLFFTVRAEDLEAGVQSAYIQFKNPNSKYQAAAQGGDAVEHKEYFATVGQGGANPSLGAFSVTEVLTGQEFPLWLQPRNPTRPDRRVNENNLGIEFECEVVSVSQSLASGAASYFQHRGNRRITQTAVGMTAGLYVPGLDDLTAFSGSANLPPLDPNVTDDPAIDNDNGIWLKLERLPDAQQDKNGGVLYGATWNAPREPSDWYMDVILYDRAINPFNPSSQSNWIIYDNIWGFSDAQGLNSDAVDLLFVSDYTLGQKFQFTRFGDPNASASTNNNVRDNLPLVQFGAESYYTDRDLTDALDGVNALDAPFATTPPTNPRVFDTLGAFAAGSNVGGSPAGTSALLTHNPLGFGSYTDSFLDADSTSVTEITRSGGIPVTGIRPSVGRYSIWRILSRGAVPANVLADYLPAPGVRPPDTRPNPNNNNLPFEETPQNFPIVNRAIIWAAPFAATSFRGAGAIADLQTQTDLSNYVQNGGRLFISGQDVAFALGNGNSFLTQVLGAQLINGGSGGQRGLTAAPASDRTRQIATDPFLPAAQQHAYTSTTNRQAFPYNPPSAGIELTFFDGAVSTLSRGDTGRTSLGSAGPVGSAGYLDLIQTFGTGEVVYNYSQGGTPAMVFNRFGAGEAVFAAFGFESITDLWREYTPTGAMFSVLANDSRRAELMHNITDSFRTGAISGRILDDNASPVSDAVVYAINPATPNARAVGTALTDASGNYIIYGLPPGFYIVVADRSGFYRQSSVGAALHGGSRASVNLNLKRANPGRLAGVQYPADYAPKAGRPRIGTTNIPQGGVFRTDDRTGIGGVPILAFRTETSATGIRRVGYLTYTSTGDPGIPTNINASGRLLQVGEYEFPTSLPIGGYTVICNPKALTATGQIENPVTNPVTVQDGSGAPVRTVTAREEYRTVIVTTPPQQEVDLGVDNPATTAVNEATVVINNLVQIEADKTAGVDFRLAADAQPIRGEVRQENADGSAGAGVPNVTVQATFGGGVVGQAVTDANGQFTLLNNSGTPDNASDDQPLFDEGLYVVSVVVANGYDLVAEPTGRSKRPSVTIQVGGPSSVAVEIKEPRDESQPLIKPGALIIEKLPPGSVSGLVTQIPGSIPTSGVTVRLYVSDTAGNRIDFDNDASNGITPRYTTQTGALQTVNGYRFNYLIAGVETGTYVADVALRGFSPSPILSSVFTVTTSAETRNINFTLEPPKIYGGGVQLISIPLDYSATAAATDPRLIFGLVTGTEQYNVFNVAEWAGGPDYRTGPTIPLVRGKGYFVRFGGQTAVTNSEGTAPTGNELQVDLFPGWNLIGHPFARLDNPYAVPGDIDLASGTRFTGPDGIDSTFDEAVAKGYVRGIAYGYTGENSNSQYFQSSVLKPWLGYWFQNTSNQTIRMRYLRPNESAISRSVKGRKPGAAITRAEQEKIRFRSIDSKNTLDWRLQLAVRQGDLLDTDNSIGVTPGAKDGYDTQFDTQKPPIMTSAPMVYLSIDGKNATGGRAVLADDIRDGSQVGVGKRTWDFSVQPAANQGAVVLSWPNVNRLPRGIEPFLVDVATGKRIPLRSASSYKYTPSSEEAAGRSVHRFQIEVAKPSSVPLMLTNVRQTRVDGRGVGQNGYRISFKVTREADVTAEIQTLTGRTVSRLTTRGRSVGDTSLFLNRRAQDGSELPAGTYILTLTAKDNNGSVVQVRQPIVNLR